MAALAGPEAARASVVFDWSYTGNNSGPVSASGTVSTTPLGSGTYEVTAITGQRNGVPITGLASYASDDQLVYTPAANLYGVDAAVDFYGLAYEVGGVDYNVYYIPTFIPTTNTFYCGAYGYCEVGPSSDLPSYPSGIVESFTLAPAPAPEPSALGLLGAGLAGLGLLRRRHG